MHDEITIDVNIGDDDIQAVGLDIEISEPIQKKRFEGIRNLAAAVGSKVLSVKDADIFKSVQKLQEENPGYSFLIYKHRHENRYIRSTMSKRVTVPIDGYYFFTPEEDLLYVAETAELKRQNLKIIYDDKTVSEIKEKKHTLKKSSFIIKVDGIVRGELVRENKERGVEIFTFGNWVVRERWNGNLELCTHDNKLIASWRKTGFTKTLMYWPQAEEALIVTLMVAINAYHNSVLRKLNHGKPYEVERNYYG